MNNKDNECVIGQVSVTTKISKERGESKLDQEIK